MNLAIDRLNKRKKDFAFCGFSLVELSIVLVILGLLLVGGVLSGRSLIKASELRSVITEREQFYTAVQSFKEKYFYLPGDLPNATQIWGALDPDPATCNIMPSTSLLTCNGNGNGIIEPHVSPTTTEEYRFWQHLANAGLIKGSYSGAAVGDGFIPKSRYNKGFWFVIEEPDVNSGGPGFGGSFVGHYGLTLYFMGNVNILRPDEAYYIDSKVDDGKPGSGSLVATGYLETGYYDNPGDCTTTDDTTMITADYKLSTTDVVCYLLFRGMR